MKAPASRQERDPRLWTADQFLDFLGTRPDEERWQLVDGLAIMMVPPSFTHQKIGRNLFVLLDRALSAHRPDLLVLYETGVRVPGVADFNPTPDLLVVPANAAFDRYADVFFMTAEIMSPSNRAEMIERKLELYRRHPDNLYCLTIDQDAPHVALWSREKGWARSDLYSMDDLLDLPAFGLEARLADIYAGTRVGR